MGPSEGERPVCMNTLSGCLLWRDVLKWQLLAPYCGARPELWTPILTPSFHLWHSEFRMAFLASWEPAAAVCDCFVGPGLGLEEAREWEEMQKEGHEWARAS